MIGGGTGEDSEKRGAEHRSPGADGASDRDSRKKLQQQQQTLIHEEEGVEEMAQKVGEQEAENNEENGEGNFEEDEEEEDEPDAVQLADERDERLSFSSMVINLVNMFVGTAILSLPYAFGRFGWASIIALFLVSLLFWHGCSCLCEAALHAGQGTRVLVYSDLMAGIFGSPKVCAGMVFFQLEIVNALYIMYVAINLSSINSKWFPLERGALFSGLLAASSCFLDWEGVTFASKISAIAIGTAAIGVLACGASVPSEANVQTALIGSVDDGVVAIAIMYFCCKSPSRMNPNPRVCAFSLSGISCF